MKSKLLQCFHDMHVLMCPWHACIYISMACTQPSRFIPLPSSLLIDLGSQRRCACRRLACCAAAMCCRDQVCVCSLWGRGGQKEFRGSVAETLDQSGCTFRGRCLHLGTMPRYLVWRVPFSGVSIQLLPPPQKNLRPQLAVKSRLHLPATSTAAVAATVNASQSQLTPREPKAPVSPRTAAGRVCCATCR
jgi:hypothetical protein